MEKLYPVTLSQKDLYSFQKFYPEDPSYNLTFLYKITGKFDLIRFKNVFEAIYDAIDVFKVNYIEKGAELFQKYVDSREYAIEVLYNASDESPEDFRKKVVDYAENLENTPIDLNCWPLFQVKLFSYEPSESYLLLCCPHIISDGYSYYLLINSLNKYYNSTLSIAEVRESAAKDFANHFLQDAFLIKNANSEYATEYFKSELNGTQSFALQKIKQPRNAQKVLEGQNIHFSVEKDLVDPYLSQNHVSENSFLLSIYAIFLRKTTGEDKVIIGFPVLNRNKNSKDVFGYFVNTLPLVINFNEGQTFKDLLSQINRKTFSLLKGQAFSLGEMNGIDLKFNNFFTYYQKEFNYELSESKVERLELQKNQIMSEIRCTVENKPNHYKFSVEYGHYFERVEVARIFKHIIFSVLEQEDCLIRDIGLLSIVDVVETYQEINGGYQAVNQNISIKDTFEAMAVAYPERVALVDTSSEWTYGYLNAMANKIARSLRIQGESIQQFVVSLEKNNYLIAVILAVLKLGKCYVPVDLASPEQRVQYILSDLDSAMIIGKKDFLDRNKLAGAHVVEIENLMVSAMAESSDNLNCMVAESDFAYMIYTSGSTGDPKGVQVSNANLMSLFSACKEKFDFNQNDTWTLFHSYGFDFSVWEIFGCLLSGGRLVLIDHLTARSPHDFYEILSRYQVTILNQTPTAFRGVIKEDEVQKKNLALRYVIFGGEALYFPFLKRWVSRHPLSKTRMINMYGITETTIHVTFYELSVNDLDKSESVIGKPLDHLGLYIVNAEGNILPKGLPGEILIYGTGVSSGYYRKPELSHKKFIEHSDCPGLCYRSGDLGMVNENGEIEYLGRMDRQVQIRGYRVEIGEIESAIMKSGFVKDCTVGLVRFDAESDERLTAYMVAAGGYLESALKEYLKNTLPQYMIPSLFVVVESFALTVNGKIDFETLKNNIQLNVTSITSDNEIERCIHTIIADITKNSMFSMHDNFFDIGVTSIDLTEIFYRLNENFKIQEMSIVDMFEHSSITQLSKYVESRLMVEDKNMESLYLSGISMIR